MLGATAAAGALGAQSNTAEMLQRAIRLYENNEVEQALVILNQIISPQSPFVVSNEQRIAAYRYLGASLALQRGEAKRDSAVQYFRAALERDPFTDLDPQSFSPSQLAVFGRARDATFAVGIRTVEPDTVDPRSERIRLRVLSTHQAHLRLEIREAGVTRRVVFEGENVGLREIEWDGLTDDGRLLPAGRYELRLLGESRRITMPAPLRDSTRAYFDLSWDHPALEDTLPELGEQDLLPAQYPRSAATSDLLRGAGVAAGALVVQALLSGSDLGGNRTAAGVVVSTGLGVGIGAFFYRNSHRDIPANIAENDRRQAERAQANGDIGGRNEVKLRETKLVIGPAAGAVQ
jgi:hypothetical protein